jgi:hypothetical protein
MKSSKFLITFALASTAAFATTWNAPTDMVTNGLDHHLAYTWGITGVSLSGLTITDATLTFTNLKNWDSNPNSLFIHLLDTARTASGEATFADAVSSQVPVTDISDDFVNPRYHHYLPDPLAKDANGNSASWLVDATTGDTKLAQYDNLGTTASTKTINFTGAQISALTSYINNGGNFAFGFDSDCHYYDTGIAFTMNTTPSKVPEPASILLLGTGLLASLQIVRRKTRKQS